MSSSDIILDFINNQNYLSIDDIVFVEIEKLKKMSEVRLEAMIDSYYPIFEDMLTNIDDLVDVISDLRKNHGQKLKLIKR